MKLYRIQTSSRLIANLCNAFNVPAPPHDIIPKLDHTTRFYWTEKGWEVFGSLIWDSVKETIKDTQEDMKKLLPHVKKKIADPNLYIEEIDEEWIPLFLFEDAYQIAI